MLFSVALTSFISIMTTVNTGGTAAAGTLPAPLPAGSTENQLMFSYRVDDKHGGRTG